LNEKVQSPPIDWDPIDTPSQALEQTQSVLRNTCPLPRADVKGLYPFWSVMRYEDVTAAARNTNAFKNATPRLKRRRVPLESDAPEHATIRRVMQPFFLPKALAQFEPLARRWVGELLDSLFQAGRGDAAAELARPLPPQILLAFLGRPKSDWQKIKEWSERSYLQLSPQPDEQAKFTEADASLWAYAEDVVRERVGAPRDPGIDMVTTMLRASIDGQALDPAIVVGTIRLLLAAGHDSTTSALAICLHYLAQNQEDQQTLRSQPDLLPTAIEEILRYRSPVVMMPRLASTEIEMHGRHIQSRERLMLNWASANRDPRAFEQADKCVLARHPNRHVVFGHGVHTCLGAPLARQELRIALQELLSRSKSFEMDGEVRYHIWHRLAPTRLPIRITAA
jgi:cytochrome P450 family 130